MKTFNTTSLPDTIEYKGETLKLFITAVGEPNSKKTNVANYLSQRGLTVCLVSCMSKNLRGKTDLHNQPYQPNLYIYANQNPEQFEKYRETVEFWKKQFSPRTKKWQRETLKSLTSGKVSPFDDVQGAQKIQALKEIKAL